MSKNDRQEGFTLIELVVGLAIMATLLALVFGVLRLGYRAEEQGMARSERAQIERVLSDRLVWLLRGAYPYVYRKKDDDRRYLGFEGSLDKVEFVTSSTDPFNEGPAHHGGLTRLTLRADSEGLKVGSRIFFTYEDDGVSKLTETVFMREVVEVRFSYLDAELDSEDKPTGDTVWEDEWGGEPAESDEILYLPLAVRVEAVLLHEGQRYKLPPIIVRIPAGGIDGAL